MNKSYLIQKFGVFIEQTEQLIPKLISSGEKSLAYYNIAQAQLQLRLFRKALRSCEQSIEQNPLNLSVVLVKAKCLKALGKHMEANELLQGVLDENLSVLTDISILEDINNFKNSLTDLESPTSSSTISSSPLPTPPAPSTLPINENSQVVASIVKAESNKSKEKVPSVIEKKVVNSINNNSNNSNDCKIRLQLEQVHRQYIGETSDHFIKPPFLLAMRKNLPHVTTESLVDDLVCVAYVKINLSQLEQAASLFQLLHQYRRDVPAAMIGLGSLLAMQKQLDPAIQQFSAAISCDPTIADAWKRRGQTKAAKGLVADAITDLTRCLQLLGGRTGKGGGDVSDCLNQRGLVFYQAKDFLRALLDFRQAHRSGMSSPQLMNHIGLCEGQLGEVAASIEAHRSAVRMDENFKEAYLNIGLMHREVGQWQAAMVAFQQAEDCKHDDRHFFQPISNRAFLHYLMGDVKQADEQFHLALEVADTSSDRGPFTEEVFFCLIRKGLCRQAVGDFSSAVACFEEVLGRDREHPVGFQTEVALQIWALLVETLPL